MTVFIIDNLSWNKVTDATQLSINAEASSVATAIIFLNCGEYFNFSNSLANTKRFLQIASVFRILTNISAIFDLPIVDTSTLMKTSNENVLSTPSFISLLRFSLYSCLMLHILEQVKRFLFIIFSTIFLIAAIIV